MSTKPLISEQGFLSVIGGLWWTATNENKAEVSGAAATSEKSAELDVTYYGDAALLGRDDVGAHLTQVAEAKYAKAFRLKL